MDSRSSLSVYSAFLLSRELLYSFVALVVISVLLLYLTRLVKSDTLTVLGWGMAFWMCLVHHGARVGGLRELDQFHLEQVYSLSELFPFFPTFLWRVYIST